MFLHEPAVALTDFGLAVECGLFCFLLRHRNSSAIRTAFQYFFAATGIAALFGGLVHGFFPSQDSLAYVVFWRASLMSIAAAAVAATIIGAELCFHKRLIRATRIAAVLALVAFVAVVWLVRDDFVTAIYAYAPAAAFLFICFALALLRTRNTRYGAGLTGILLTFLAAAVQRSSVMIGVLDHNALYHIVQAVALALIFAAGHVPSERTATAQAFSEESL